MSATDEPRRLPLEFASLVEKQSGLPSWKFVVVDPTRFDPGRLDRFVVFVHAPWSGPSVQALKALGTALAQAGSEAPRLLVLELDAIAPEYSLAWFGELVQGWGETYWIRQGVIIHRLARYSRPWEVEGFIRQLATGAS